jgi:hypothetical protein
MKNGISNPAVYSQEQVDRMLLQKEQQVIDSIVPFGGFDVKITRHDGRVEQYFRKNVVLKEGLNRIATRAVQATGTTPFFIIGIGTATATHTLSSDQPNWGEVSRKSSAVTGASAQSREWIFMVATWGGAADSITSVALDTAFCSDFANSHATTGIYLGAAPGLGVTLANSDLLHLTYRVRVGSHDIDHTT